MSATNREELTIRMGFDASELARGTQAMLDKQKKSASDYVSFWTGAMRQKEATELAIEVEGAQRRNQARLAWRKRGLEQEQKLIKEMSVGNLPDNLRGWNGRTSVAGNHEGGLFSGISGTISNISSLFSKFALVSSLISGVKWLYNRGANAGMEARQTSWEAEDAGFSTAGYQAFLRSVSKTGGDAESAKTGIMKLVSAIGEARSGSTEATAKFDKWHIALNDVNGAALTGEQVYKNVLEQISQMSDPTQKAAMMTDLFGKSYRQFIDAVDKNQLQDAAEWVHKFAPSERELGSMRTWVKFCAALPAIIRSPVSGA